MTKGETIKILAMLRGFYPSVNIDAKLTAQMWHLIIGEYEYGIAQKAVINFVKNDERQYAAFPTPAMIINAIRRERAIGQGIYNAVYYDKAYESLTQEAQGVISKEKYNELRMMSSEELVKNEKLIVADILEEFNKPLLEGENVGD